MNILHFKPAFVKVSAMLCIILLFFSFDSFGQIIYVNFAANSGTNNGTNWTNAFTNLQDALNTATAGQQIWVAKGTYLPSSTLDRSASFVLQNGVELYGGFAGTETTLAQRDWKNNPTILSGDLMQNDGPAFANTNDNSYSVLFSKNVNASTLLDGFTICGGNANDPNSNDLERGSSGGAWFNEAKPAGQESSPTVRNCTFTNNQATSFGGAIYNSAFFSGKANPIYDNCTFSYNFSINDGGALYNQGSFDGESNPRIEYCRFVQNSTNSSGGAIFNNGIQGNSSPFIMNTVFQQNIANIDLLEVGNAGAMYNQANNGQSNPTIINCIFDRNEGYSGGAVYCLGSNGGNSSPKIINSTFYHNKAVGPSGSGGAVYNNANDNSGTSSSEIANCIFWGNTAKGHPSVLRNVFSSPHISYCLVDLPDCAALNNGPNANLQCGDGMIFMTDPQFIDSLGGNFHLQPISPAINAGDDNQVVNAGIHIDLDAHLRIQDGHVDMGVYEKSAYIPTIDTLLFTSQHITVDTAVASSSLNFDGSINFSDTTFFNQMLFSSDSLLITDNQFFTDSLTITDSLAMLDSLFITNTTITTDSLIIKNFNTTIDSSFIVHTQINFDTLVTIDSFYITTTNIETDSFIVRSDAIPTDTLIAMDTSFVFDLFVEMDSIFHTDTLLSYDTLFSTNTVITLDTFVTKDTLFVLDTIIKEHPLSTYQLSNPLDFKVYPNPASEWIHLVFQQADDNTIQIEIYNLLGQLEYSKKLNSNNGNTSLLLPNIPNGYHLLKLSNDKGAVGLKKFLKE